MQYFCCANSYYAVGRRWLHTETWWLHLSCKGKKNVFVYYKRKGGQRHVWVKVCLSFSASGSIHHIHRLACLETLMFVFGQVATPIQLERSKKENEQLHILITDLHPNDYGVSHYHWRHKKTQSIRRHVIRFGPESATLRRRVARWPNLSSYRNGGCGRSELVAIQIINQLRNRFVNILHSWDGETQ